MRDFLAKDAEKMRYVEQVSREVARLYGYGEVITPVMEHYDLLAAKSGEEIRERMYAFQDFSGRRVALRPEFTASMARLVATKMMSTPKPLRLFCVGSLYRYDEPQYGRYREFWQADYEIIGSSRPEADAEILTITHDMMEKLRFRRYNFKIGHVGVLRGVLGQEGIGEEQQNKVMQLLDKKRWAEALAYTRELNVSEKCLSTLKDVFETRGRETSTVLRKAMDSVKGYEEAVAAVKNLREILELTEGSGSRSETWVEMGFARGLEYYTGMIFEVYAPEMEIALGGGGRYDRLIELFGGEPTPALGVAQGIDRIVLAVRKQRARLKVPRKKRVVVIPVNEEMRTRSLQISLTLRSAGISTEVEVMGRTVSRALSDADRRGATHAVILGPEEVNEGRVVLRDMKKREQRIVEIEGLVKDILQSNAH